MSVETYSTNLGTMIPTSFDSFEGPRNSLAWSPQKRSLSANELQQTAASKKSFEKLEKFKPDHFIGFTPEQTSFAGPVELNFDYIAGIKWCHARALILLSC